MNIEQRLASIEARWGWSISECFSNTKNVEGLQKLEQMWFIVVRNAFGICRYESGILVQFRALRCCASFMRVSMVYCVDYLFCFLTPCFCLTSSSKSLDNLYIVPPSFESHPAVTNAPTYTHHSLWLQHQAKAKLRSTPRQCSGSSSRWSCFWKSRQTWRQLIMMVGSQAVRGRRLQWRKMVTGVNVISKVESWFCAR